MREFYLSKAKQKIAFPDILRLIKYLVYINNRNINKKMFTVAMPFKLSVK